MFTKYVTDLHIQILFAITLLFTISLFMTRLADSLQIHLNLRANHRLNQYNKTRHKFSRGEEIHKVRRVQCSLQPFRTVPMCQLFSWVGLGLRFSNAWRRGGLNTTVGRLCNEMRLLDHCDWNTTRSTSVHQRANKLYAYVDTL